MKTKFYQLVLKPNHLELLIGNMDEEIKSLQEDGNVILDTQMIPISNNPFKAIGIIKYTYTYPDPSPTQNKEKKTKSALQILNEWTGWSSDEALWYDILGAMEEYKNQSK